MPGWPLLLVKDDSVSHLINDKAVCRTAQATPGLLKIVRPIIFLKFSHPYLSYLVLRFLVPTHTKNLSKHGTLGFIYIRRYGSLHGPISSSCGGLRPRLQKKRPVLVHVWPFLVSSSNLSNFVRNP